MKQLDARWPPPLRRANEPGAVSYREKDKKNLELI
jgi:hypothetical protein